MTASHTRQRTRSGRTARAGCAGFRGAAHGMLCAWGVVVACGTCSYHTASADDDVEQVTLHVARSWHVEHDTHHVQGLAVGDDAFWLTSVDTQAEVGWVYRVDRRTLKVVQERKLVDGGRIHPGGIQLVGRALWVPLAQYRRRSTSTILCLDAVSLCTIASFTVDDHIGAIAYDGDDRLFAANWDSLQIYTFNTQGEQLDVVDNPTPVRFQDVEFHDGKLLGLGRTTVDGNTVGTVVAIDPRSWQVTSRWILAGASRGGVDYGREGFSARAEAFYAMPEDGPDTTVYEFPRKRP